MKRLIGSAVAATALLLAGCGGGAEQQPSVPEDAPPAGAFRSDDCNGVTDADITKATQTSVFKKVVDSDAGCFWQEDTMLGTFGAGMGISTWWYRGSDMDVERELEQQAGRTITELAVDGNKGFKASDTNACSIYVAKGGDVITWSIQTMNSAMLPDLCSITDRLAQLSQQRVN
jgi:hypothetical protein